MGWTFTWVSSGGSDFDFDYHVSFTPEEVAAGRALYNYANRDPKSQEREGHSIFYMDRNRVIFHTYSCYDRGNDKLNLHYHYLDLVPLKGGMRADADRSGYGDTTSTRTSESLVSLRHSCGPRSRLRRGLSHEWSIHRCHMVVPRLS